jgi:hypothetical protein
VNPTERNPTEEEARLLRQIATLEGRVAALESALERRSRELRMIQGAVCRADLVQVARIVDGLPPLPRIAHQLEYWTETTEISPANLENVLEDLWTSLTPAPSAPPSAPSPRRKVESPALALSSGLSE